MTIVSDRSFKLAFKAPHILAPLHYRLMVTDTNSKRDVKPMPVKGKWAQIQTDSLYKVAISKAD